MPSRYWLAWTTAWHLIAPEVIEPIQHLKISHLGNHNPRLHTDETLIALSISAVTDPNAERAMEHLAELSAAMPIPL